MYSSSLILVIFLMHTIVIMTRTTTTKSPTSIASILLPQTTKDTPTLDLPSKADDKEALLHLEQSLKSVTHMFHSKNRAHETRIHIRDIPNLFACLDENSNIDGCSKIDHFM
jgi:hypothetical protein